MSQVEMKDLENVTELTFMGETFNMYGTAKHPLFLAQDVAAMIEYSQDKVGQMLENVDEGEKLTDTIYRAGQQREMWFLTEFGLYELLMQSRKPLAKRFKVEVKKMLQQIRLGGTTRIETVGNNILIENAHILFRNFSGEETKFNRAGDRNFCVLIEDEDMLKKLTDDGWNIKQLKPRDDGEEGAYYVSVSVRFNNFPPKVYMITSRNKTLLSEINIGELDYVEISKVDLTINPSNWSVNGNSGVKAYLKNMYVTINEDVLADKYDIGDDEEPFN